MAKAKFPHVLAAVKKRDGSSLWEIGDALVRDIGHVKTTWTPASASDGSTKELRQCAKELSDEGYDDYAVERLKALRLTASHFQPKDRVANLAFEIHRSAGTPEALQAIIAGAPKGTKITRRYVRLIQTRQIEQEHKRLAKEDAERRAALDKARREKEKAEEDERESRKAIMKAKDDKERAAATEKRREASERGKKARHEIAANKSPPPRSPAAPKAQEVPILAIEGEFWTAASRAQTLADQTRKEIEPHIHLFTPAAIALMIEMALKASNKWREVADALRKSPRKASAHGHLYAVND